MSPSELKALFDVQAETLGGIINDIIDYLLSGDFAGELVIKNPTTGEELIDIQTFLDYFYAEMRKYDESLQRQIDEVVKTVFANYKALGKRIDTENYERKAGDRTLYLLISAEVAARVAEDKNLQAQISALVGDPSGGIVTQVNSKTGIVVLTSDDINNPETENTITDDLRKLRERPQGGATRSELDDMQIMTGTFTNAGAGVREFRFPPSEDGVQVMFETVPQVFLQVVGENMTASVSNVTKEGFCYRLRNTANATSDVSAAVVVHWMAIVRKY